MILRIGIALVAAALLVPAALAGPPKDYASLFLQGKLADSVTGQPLPQVAVRLTSATATLETLSDRRGVFRFEKLPLEPFELRITTPDGRVIRAIQHNDPDNPEGTRFRLKVGRGYGIGIRVRSGEERITVDVPEPNTRWPKLWAELAIFVGAAGALAL